MDKPDVSEAAGWSRAIDWEISLPPYGLRGATLAERKPSLSKEQRIYLCNKNVNRTPVSACPTYTTCSSGISGKFCRSAPLPASSAAVVIFVLRPAVYRSEAKLFVRYVQDARLPAGMGENAQIKSPDSRGDNIISSEAEVLTSLDLALQVVDAVGAEEDSFQSWRCKRQVPWRRLMVRRNMLVDVPKKSDILKIVFQHPDKDVVQAVLQKLISFYQKKHIEIHQTPGVIDDALAQKTDSARSALAATEDELKTLKKKLGIENLDEMKKAKGEQKAHLETEVFSAEAEYGQREAAFDESCRQERLGVHTNATAAASDVTTPPEIINEYKMLGTRLDGFRKREQELMTQFSDENVLLKDLRAQIADSERWRNKLQLDYPALSSRFKTCRHDLQRRRRPRCRFVMPNKRR